MAATRALYHVMQDRDAKIAVLQEQNTDLEARLKALEKAVAALSERL